MKKYVVAYNSSMDSSIIQRIIAGISATSVMWDILIDLNMTPRIYDYDNYDLDSVEGIAEYAFDVYEANISVIEI